MGIEVINPTGAEKVTGVPTSVGYGTALPSSPQDGQEYILVDSVSAPTYVWRVRYNASSASSYKWEFIGGSPVYVRNDASSTRANTAYGDLGDGTNPTFTVPNAGDWSVQFGAELTVADSTAFCSPMMGGSEAVDADAVTVGETGGSSVVPLARVERTIRKDALAASTAIKLRYKSASGTVTAQRRFLTIQPVRIA